MYVPSIGLCTMDAYKGNTPYDMKDCIATSMNDGNDNDNGYDDDGVCVIITDCTS